MKLESPNLPCEKYIPQEIVSEVMPAQPAPVQPAPVQQEQPVPVQAAVQPTVHPVQANIQNAANQMPLVAAAQVPLTPQAENKAISSEEEARLIAKEEARKLLTQPVVQISAEQRKTVSQLNRESREKHVIHPISGGKRYNGKSAASGDKGTSPDSEHPNKGGVAVKSSLKKILDDSNPHNG